MFLTRGTGKVRLVAEDRIDYPTQSRQAPHFTSRPQAAYVGITMGSRQPQQGGRTHVWRVREGGRDTDPQARVGFALAQQLKQLCPPTDAPSCERFSTTLTYDPEQGYYHSTLTVLDWDAELPGESPVELTVAATDEITVRVAGHRDGATTKPLARLCQQAVNQLWPLWQSRDEPHLDRWLIGAYLSSLVFRAPLLFPDRFPGLNNYAEQVHAALLDLSCISLGPEARKLGFSLVENFRGSPAELKQLIDTGLT